MIKLIVSDVDDTLLPESTMDLNPEYFEVIKKLQEKGVIFVAASGRQKVSIKKVFAPIQDSIAYLADNGTDISAGDFVESMKFEEEDYVKLAQDLESLSSRVLLTCRACLTGTLWRRRERISIRLFSDTAAR